MNSKRILVVDNSVQVDRVKTAGRKRHVEAILAQFDFTGATSVGLLEFKATIIQQCITIHNQLRLRGRFTEVRDALLEKAHRQSRLRAHIFNNLIQVYGSSFDDSVDDRLLAEKARLKLEYDIPALYTWFRNSVGAMFSSDIQCTRAEEPPILRRTSFGVNLRTCRRGENKSCAIEPFIRKHGPFFSSIRTIVAADAKLTQLADAVNLFDRVVADDNIDLSHSDCRSAGDCLIALEGKSAGATHCLSTNGGDWQPVANAADLKLELVTYPEERSK